MNKILISYARADGQRASTLRRLFESKGWTVWQDRTDIPPGVEFDDAIEQAVREVRCVVVIWTENSVRSQWVKTEATAAAESGTLVPVRFDDAPIPLRFRRLQTVDLRHWSGEESSPESRRLLDRVGALLGTTLRPQHRERSFSELWRRVWSLKLTAIAAGAATAVALYLVFGLLITAAGMKVTSSSNLLVISELSCILLGGWVAARRAGFSEVLHGVALGVIVVVFGILTRSLAPAPSATVPGWLAVAYIPVAAVGGWLEKRAKKHPS